MRILHVASEVVPFAKTGGLADVVGTLPQKLADSGHDVAIALPKYKTVEDARFHLETVIPALLVPFAGGTVPCTVKRTPFTQEGAGRLCVYFIEQEELFGREGLYGHVDDPERFIFFDRAVLEMLKALKWSPEVLHCHDWQTGFIPAYLKSLYGDDPFFGRSISVFTIHNLAYQGACPAEKLAVTGLPGSMFNYHELEFYGQLNPMKGGLVYADAVTTVSEKYALEIQTPEYGERLEGVLRGRKDTLTGIVNGIDYDEWNPKTDPLISHNYDAATLAKKTDNKRTLQTWGRLPSHGRRRIPVLGCVSRLSSQKGFDLLSEIIDDLMALMVQFVLLGAGEDHYMRLFEEIGRKYPDQTYFTLGKFDNALAHQIYAGSDMFLMPSRYEPCGLGQLISLRYGTIPVVRATGGLDDTIQEYDAAAGTGNGFRSEEYTSTALLDCLQRAVKTYKLAPRWKPLIANAMQCDFSWNVSAEKYVELYEKTLRSKS